MDRASDLDNYLPEDKLSFSDLTAEDRSLITNGCGGKGAWLDPPDYLFKASCDWHDFEYWRGGTEGDRLDADRGFFRAMLEDVREANWWRRPFGRLRAWAYYRAIRWFGRPYFSYGYQRGKRSLQEFRETAATRGLVDYEQPKEGTP